MAINRAIEVRDGALVLQSDGTQGKPELITLWVNEAGVGLGTIELHLDEATAQLVTRPAASGGSIPSRAIRLAVDWALGEASELALTRVETRISPDDDRRLRAAVWAGMRREGVRRDLDAATGAPADLVVLARLTDDPAIDVPQGFRAVLNATLPRKRVIAQLLVRDRDERVLMCGLTYKSDWDLPGGVVEPGESPEVAAAREVAEELGLSLTSGGLVLADWLPPWGGWDDALCLVFDGGVHDRDLIDTIVRERREIQDVAWLDAAQVEQRAADFTARRVAASLAALHSLGPVFTESGRATHL